MIGPVLMIGCGGSGIMSVRYAREAVMARLAEHRISQMPEAWQFIGLDTIETQSGLGEVPPLPSRDYCKVTGGFSLVTDLYAAVWASHPPKKPNSGYRELLGWLPHHQDVPGDLRLGAGQLRAVGRAMGTHSLMSAAIKNKLIAAYDAAKSADAELRSVCQALQIPIEDGADFPVPLVIIVGSCAGGTGAGIMLDTVDVVRRMTSDNINPVLISYDPEIFGQDFAPPMAANSIMFTSEVLNAFWSTNGGNAGLFPAPLGEPPNRGPFAVFTVGRQNMSGADLGNSSTVYKATGDSISSWILSPQVRTSLQEFVLGNRNARARQGGYGFGGQSVKGGITSFGSATIAVGRSRFRRYAKAFLMRDFYEFHWSGFQELAVREFGVGKASRNETILINDLAENFKKSFVADCGLEQEFNASTNTVSNGLIDSILSASHTQTTSAQFKGKIFEKLDGAAPHDVAYWRNEFAVNFRILRPSHEESALKEASERLDEWYRSLAANVIAETNKLIAQSSLPVAIRVLELVIEDINRMPARFRQAHDTANQKATGFANDANAALTRLSGTVKRDAPDIVDACDKIGLHVAFAVRAKVLQQMERSMDLVARNVLGPIRSSMQRAKDGDLSKVNLPQPNEPAVVTQWPRLKEVPKSFVPSEVEFLLETSDQWPDILQDLLVSCVTTVGGESPVEAFRRELTTGDLDDPARRPALLRLSGEDLSTWTASRSLDVSLRLDPESLDAAVTHWIADNTTFSNHLAEGLQSYLQDVADVRRLDTFRTQLTRALKQSRPLIRINEPFLQQVGAGLGNANPMKVDPVIDQLPFKEGHPAREVAEQLIRAELDIPPGTDIGRFFVDYEKEASVMSSFLRESINPVFSLTFTEQFSNLYDNLGVQSKTLRPWFKFKRAKTLSEFVPVPEDVYLAMIRGFLVARLLGKVTNNVADGVEIIGHDGAKYPFPHPLLSQVKKEDCLPAILEAMPLCFARVTAQRTDAFAAYRELFLYGIPSEDEMSPDQYEVRGLLGEALRTAVVPGPTLDNPRPEIAGSSVEERTEALAAFVEKWKEQLLELDKRLAPTGEEMRREDGSIEPRELYTLEIVDDMTGQFQVVADAIRTYGKSSHDDGGRIG